MGKVETIINIAKECARKTPDFHKIKGAGGGDRATNKFMNDLRILAKSKLEKDYSEQHICGVGNNSAVDFYVPEESTIIEVALSLRNPNSEFERDILKALIAKEYRHKIDKIVFLSKPGAQKRHGCASSKEIISWVKTKHKIKIEIHEL